MWLLHGADFDDSKVECARREREDDLINIPPGGEGIEQRPAKHGGGAWVQGGGKRWRWGFDGPADHDRVLHWNGSGSGGETYGSFSRAGFFKDVGNGTGKTSSTSHTPHEWKETQ